MIDETEAMYRRLSERAMDKRQKKSNYKKPRGQRRFTPDQVRDIRKFKAEGVRNCNLATLYGCDWNTIWSIVKGRSYKDVE